MSILNQLRGGLVVSCQPVPGGPLDQPDITASFALAALDGGARGLRIEGIANLKAVRKLTDAPIIGLVKSDRTDTEVRITSTVEDVNALADEGADIIAFDATDRPRPVPVQTLVEAIHGRGKLAMADCSVFEDGQRAAELNCDILGSTMSGYVGETVPKTPDIELVSALSGLGVFVLAEGRYNRPDYAALAITAGADGVVVGSAITRPEHIARWFAEEIRNARRTAEDV